MNWHKLALCCPKCEKPLTIIALLFSADGELMVDGCCVGCGIKLAWKNTTAYLICRALVADLEEAKRKNPKPPPKLLLLPPISGFTSEDKLWLKDMHIKPEDGNEKGGTK